MIFPIDRNKCEAAMVQWKLRKKTFKFCKKVQKPNFNQK